MKANTLASTGWILYGVSMVLPAAHPEPGEWIVGAEALRMATVATLLFQEPNTPKVLALQGLTNLLMLATPFVFHVWRARPIAAITVTCMALATLINAAPLMGLTPYIEPGQLSVGYYAWLSSFVLVSTALASQLRDAFKA